MTAPPPPQARKHSGYGIISVLAKKRKMSQTNSKKLVMVTSARSDKI